MLAVCLKGGWARKGENDVVSVSVSVFVIPEAEEERGLAGWDVVVVVVVESWEAVNVSASERGVVSVVVEISLSPDEVSSPPAARTVFCCCSRGCVPSSLSNSARYHACDTAELVCAAAGDHRR